MSKGFDVTKYHNSVTANCNPYSNIGISISDKNINNNYENRRFAYKIQSLGRDYLYDSTLSVPRPFPYQVWLSYQGTSERNYLQRSESCFDNNNNSRNNLFFGELNEEFWNRFKDYLKATHREKSIIFRLSYAKKYYNILINGNATDIQSVSHDKRLQIMKSLSVLSKFMGCYDKWKSIKERYQLKWSNDDSIQIFQNLTNQENNYSSMLKWVKDTCSQVPADYSNILIYCTLTGLRPDEACQSIRLVKDKIHSYHDKDKMILKHFEFPDIFIRRTKHAYVSISNDLILKIANDSCCYSYNALRCYLKRKNITMNMNYCRKICYLYEKQRNRTRNHRLIAGAYTKVGICKALLQA